MIHLDTGFLIRALVNGSSEDGVLRTWIRAGHPVGISALAWSEFLCGPVADEEIEFAQQILEEPATFGSSEAAFAAQLFNETGRKRGSFVDCMIAATAHRANAELATSNLADFRRFQPLGVRLASV